MSTPHPSAAAAPRGSAFWGFVLWSIIAIVAVSVILAPLMTVGWCEDAAAGGTSSCGSAQRSLVGIDTSIWIWLGAIALVVLSVVVVAVRRRRHTH